MARKHPLRASGRLVVLEHSSKVLAGNPLGDPHVRNLAVWLPPDYDRPRQGGRGRRYPVLYDLVGFTGSGLAHVNWKPFGENVIERAARLIHETEDGTRRSSSSPTASPASAETSTSTRRRSGATPTI